MRDLDHLRGRVLRDDFFDRAPPGSPKKPPTPVQVVPTRKGVWSGSNELGYEVPFAFDGTTPQTVFKMDEWDFPQMWTLSLGYRLEGDLDAGEVFDAKAIIEFGSGGIIQTFEMDWVVGARVSLPMNAVNVKALYEINSGSVPDNRVFLNCLLARGAAPSRATRSFILTAAGVGGLSTPIKIPAFAKSFQIVGGGDPNGDPYTGDMSYRMGFNNAATPVSAVIDGSELLQGPATKVPIPARMKYFAFENNNADIHSVHVIFNLFDE